jgi:hypothetical protein
MSLNQKYTWKDFLRDNPEHKEKKTKRTSNEGKKAFEAAYKKYIKEYLAQRQQQLEKMEERATKKRDELMLKVKDFQKAKNFPKAHFYQAKIGKQDASLARIKKQKDHAKTLQKKI